MDIYKYTIFLYIYIQCFSITIRRRLEHSYVSLKSLLRSLEISFDKFCCVWQTKSRLSEIELKLLS